MIRFVLAVAASAAFFAGAPARAEEGMWTFDNFPLDRVNAAYDLKLDRAWLDHVQGATVRLSSGCSAGVVSREGLLFTNQHCVIYCAQELSSPDQDHVAQGFLASRRQEEKTCPGMAAAILTEMRDVTSEVTAATSGLSGDAFVRAQTAATTGIENKACGDDPKRHCQVVALYQGGQYKLYQYRKYSDVRLVFAPEFSMAFFGGDPDNFNFPRYALDAAFLRLYENGKPVATPRPLIWNPRAPVEGEPVFAPGSPGKTDRLLTVAQLETQRDLYLPVTQMIRSELRGRLLTFAAQSDEHKRISTDWVFSVENSFKAMYGQHLALLRPELFAAKRAEEEALRARLTEGDPVGGPGGDPIGDPWADVAASQAEYRRMFLPYYFLEQAPNQSMLVFYARYLVRAAYEREKPSGSRLPEFADSRLPWLRDKILASVPIEEELEALVLGFYLSKAREYLGTDAETTRLLLGKAAPETLAEYLIGSTDLADVEVRRQLWEGGLEAIRQSDDRLIQYALLLDGPSRSLRAEWDAKVAAPARIAGEKIARVRFEAYGDRIAPDATFTPRLSYGRVAGWTNNSVTVAPFTSLSGLYGRATGLEPFQVSPRFLAAKDKVSGETVYNFTTTNDISGGSSGSAVVDAKGEVIGTVFDSNIHGLGGTYSYDPDLNRTVAVTTAAVNEALIKVYGADSLWRELNTPAKRR